MLFRFLALYPFVMLLAAGPRPQANTGPASGPLDAHTPYRGVALLASEIGTSTQIEEVLDLARACRLNLVVIDFAWITHHWPIADQKAIRRLSEALRKQGVQVAMMYRPRALRPAEAPIHYALDENGRAGESHNELCFAHEDSVNWAVQWGTRIRRAFPAADKIILYNLRPTCQCPDCREDRAAARIGKFLAQCHREWRRPGSTLQIGHVGGGDAYRDDVDFLCPFLSVNRTGDSPPDYAEDIARLVRLRSAVGGKPVIPLLKICWEQQTRNNSEDVARAIRACDAAGTGFILWYYEWVFHPSDHAYEPEVITAAMKEAAAAGRSTTTSPSTKGDAP